MERRSAGRPNAQVTRTALCMDTQIKTCEGHACLLNVIPRRSYAETPQKATFFTPKCAQPAHVDVLILREQFIIIVAAEQGEVCVWHPRRCRLVITFNLERK
jgi:hypothetical protein